MKTYVVGLFRYFVFWLVAAIIHYFQGGHTSALTERFDFVMQIFFYGLCILFYADRPNPQSETEVATFQRAGRLGFLMSVTIPPVIEFTRTLFTYDRGNRNWMYAVWHSSPPIVNAVILYVSFFEGISSEPWRSWKLGRQADQFASLLKKEGDSFLRAAGGLFIAAIVSAVTLGTVVVLTTPKKTDRFHRTEPVNFMNRIHPISCIGAT